MLYWHLEKTSFFNFTAAIDKSSGTEQTDVDFNFFLC